MSVVAERVPMDCNDDATIARDQQMLEDKNAAKKQKPKEEPVAFEAEDADMADSTVGDRADEKKMVTITNAASATNSSSSKTSPEKPDKKTTDDSIVADEEEDGKSASTDPSGVVPRKSMRGLFFPAKRTVPYAVEEAQRLAKLEEEKKKKKSGSDSDSSDSDSDVEAEEEAKRRAANLKAKAELKQSEDLRNWLIDSYQFPRHFGKYICVRFGKVDWTKIRNNEKVSFPKRWKDMEDSKLDVLISKLKPLRNAFVMAQSLHLQIANAKHNWSVQQKQLQQESRDRFSDLSMEKQEEAKHSPMNVPPPQAPAWALKTREQKHSNDPLPWHVMTTLECAVIAGHRYVWSLCKSNKVGAFFTWISAQELLDEGWVTDRNHPHIEFCRTIRDLNNPDSLAYCNPAQEALLKAR